MNVFSLKECLRVCGKSVENSLASVLDSVFVECNDSHQATMKSSATESTYRCPEDFRSSTGCLVHLH